jgi:hypothetical protein
MGLATSQSLLMNYQSPDEQEFVATAQPFAFSRDFIRLFFTPFVPFCGY